MKEDKPKAAKALEYLRETLGPNNLMCMYAEELYKLKFGSEA
ncbi:MAG TPA: hypothetical protein VJ110_00180 [Candidatus Nanoarchaeia archaeon]|nr:hypothetical protein [Candidatus Nanoarchaeia archaeon]